MGFRFRKSFQIAPGVRFTLGKKSSSISVGGKGFRYTVNSKGRRTKTISVPGTGISYSSSSGGTKGPKGGSSPRKIRNLSGQGASSPPPAGKPPVYRRKWFIILWLFIFPPVGIFLFLKFWPCNRIFQVSVVAVSTIWFFYAIISGGSDSDTLEESSLLPESSIASSMVIESSEVSDEVPQSIPAEESSAESSVSESSETDTSALPPEESETSGIPGESSEDETLSETVAESVSPTETAEPSSEPIAETNPQIVYWGETGTKYHIDPECRSFKGTAANSGTLDEAKAAGRTDWCGICSKSWTDQKLLEQGNPYAK